MPGLPQCLRLCNVYSFQERWKETGHNVRRIHQLKFTAILKLDLEPFSLREKEKAIEFRGTRHQSLMPTYEHVR